MTVMANTYNGVVPGPVLVVNQGDTVVINYANDDATPDTVHLHGIHDIPVSMDGVAGISQPLVAQGGHYAYRFVADTPGTFIYHSHDQEAMLNSGLYGAIVVVPARPAAGRTRRDRARFSRDGVVVANTKCGGERIHASTVRSIRPHKRST